MHLMFESMRCGNLRQDNMGFKSSCTHKMYFSNWFFVLILVILLCDSTFCVSLNEDLSLTKIEKNSLDKFRTTVSSSLPEEYMKEDIYLVRWLRARNFDIESAKAMLFENLQWRKKNNMSTIQNEDWSDLEQDYPYFVDTHDKSGRPIVSLRFGEWDIRRAVVAGKGPRLIRYLYKGLEEVTTKVRSLQKEGKQVTQWISLLDIDGYGFMTHGCIQCLTVYISYVTAYETYFPGSVHDIILINVPSIFEAPLSITKPLLRQATKDTVHVFGTNKLQWSNYLAQRVDAEQLEPNYGGIKIRTQS